MKEINRLDPEEHRLASGVVISLTTWMVHNGAPPSVGRESPMGTHLEALRDFADEPGLLPTLHPWIKCVLPYAEIVEDGQVFSDAFRDGGPIETRIIDDCVPPDWALEIREYARLRQGFRSPTRDEMVTHLTDLRWVGERWQASVARGLWSGGRLSMDSTGVLIEDKEGDGPDLREFTARMREQYGSVTLRHALQQRTRSRGSLPAFSKGAVQSNFGVGGTILTGNGKVVITHRARGVHVNPGRIYAAGGGVRWNREQLAVHGVVAALRGAMIGETEEEIGLTPENTEIIPIGFVREARRHGSPEAFNLLRTRLTDQEVVECIARNPHPDCAEVDGLIYSFNPDDIVHMLKDQKGTDIIGPKGMVILFFIARYLDLLR